VLLPCSYCVAADRWQEGQWQEDLYRPMVCAFGPYVALRFRVFHVGSGKKISTDQWCVCLGHMGLRVHLNPGSENLDFLRTTTISVILQTEISSIPDLG
jgi:hypothetical protein